MKTLFIQYFRYIHFENGGWTGTEHYTCIIHDRLSMYSTQVKKYNEKVDNQKNKTKFDSIVQQLRSTMYRLTTRFIKIKIDILFPIRFANTILYQLPRTYFAVTN